MKKISAEELVGKHWARWYSLTPLERWHEYGERLENYLALGWTLEPDPDPQSPFLDGLAKGTSPDGRPGLHIVRRG